MDTAETYAGLDALWNGAMPPPFQRVRDLLADIKAGIEPVIDLGLGEPREPMPAFVTKKIVSSQPLFAKYPPISGSDELRCAIADWLARRYGLGSVNAVDPGREVLPTVGSRDGLFFAALPAVGRKVALLRAGERPAVLMPNPYYAAYIGAAFATNAEPVFLNATPKTGFLPDLDWLEARDDILRRAAALYICSPANPQGVMASGSYTRRALELARKHDFMLFFDECYSEIYDDVAPTGGLEVAAQTPERFKNLIVFNSLSKRSNLPGLRSGFCAGDADFILRLTAIRNLIGPQMPGPIQVASAAAWADEDHVAATRAAYREKFDICDRLLSGRLGYRRPQGGFFLWLDMTQFGNGVDATVTLWKRCGVKVVPGAFLAMGESASVNPGDRYVRVALVQDAATIETALRRIVEATC